jgi:hypothetical protein
MREAPKRCVLSDRRACICIRGVWFSARQIVRLVEPLSGIVAAKQGHRYRKKCEELAGGTQT